MSGEDLKKHILQNLPYVLVFWFFCKTAGAFRLSAGTDMVSRTMAALAGLGTYISRNPLPGMNPYDLMAGLAGAAAVRAAVYFKGKNAKKYRHGVEYGSARWGA